MSAIIVFLAIFAVVFIVTAALYGIIEHGNPLAIPLSRMKSRNRLVELTCKLMQDGRDWTVEEYTDEARHPCGLIVRAKYSWAVHLHFDAREQVITSIDKLRLLRAWKKMGEFGEDNAAVLAARIIERYDDKVVPMRRRA